MNVAVFFTLATTLFAVDVAGATDDPGATDVAGAGVDDSVPKRFMT